MNEASDNQKKTFVIPVRAKVSMEISVEATSHEDAIERAKLWNFWDSDLESEAIFLCDPYDGEEFVLHSQNIKTTITQAGNDLEGSAGEIAAESEGLEPMVSAGWVIGYESDINGPDAVLVDFTPTRAELTTLAYHYLDRHFAIEEMFAMGQSGSFEIRESAFTWRRFCSIAEALSPGTPVKEFQDYIAKRDSESDAFRTEVESRMTSESPPEAK